MSEAECERSLGATRPYHAGGRVRWGLGRRVPRGVRWGAWRPAEIAPPPLLLLGVVRSSPGRRASPRLRAALSL